MGQSPEIQWSWRCAESPKFRNRMITVNWNLRFINKVCVEFLISDWKVKDWKNSQSPLNKTQFSLPLVVTCFKYKMTRQNVLPVPSNPLQLWMQLRRWKQSTMWITADNPPRPHYALERNICNCTDRLFCKACAVYLWHFLFRLSHFTDNLVWHLRIQHWHLHSWLH
jgi:hypothetical protein